MFDFIRTHQKLMQLLLLILIVPSFVLIGVSGYTNYVSGDTDLVKVGESSVTQTEFDKARRDQLQRMQQSFPGAFDPQTLDQPEVRRNLLESLVNRRVVLDQAQKNRFNVSDATLREAIASMPELQVDGKFSPERYNQVLASVGLTTRDFEQGQRAELAINRVLGPVVQSASVPAPIITDLRQALSEQRSVRVREFKAADYRDQVSVSNTDINQWYDANKATLQLPQYVNIQYLLLNEKAALDGVKAPSEADLKAYYDQNKSRYVQPARVNVSHIQVNVPSGASKQQEEQAKAKAQSILDKVKAPGANFAQIAKTDSDDAGTAANGGSLGWISPGSWPAGLEAAVFALKQGQVSDVVRGPGGFHIFMANEVQPERGESFDEAKEKVVAEVRRQLAAERFADMATRLTNLVYDNPSSLDPAADSLGLKVKKASGLARDHLLEAQLIGTNDAAIDSPDTSLLGDKRVLRAAFMGPVLNEKQNSGVIELSPDTLIVLRVDQVNQPSVPPLERVKDRISNDLTEQRALQAAQKAGEAFIAKLRSGATEQDLATLGSPITVSRIDAKGLAQNVIDSIFAAAPSPLPGYAGAATADTYVAARIESVTPGKQDNPVLASLPQQLSQAVGRSEEQALIRALRDQAGIKFLPEAEKAISGQSDKAAN
jgi:peptidyl-prolyl cis-trans isomerase D